MAITSFYYLVLVTAGALVYYIVPKKFQWTELLALSIGFYCLAGAPRTILYLVGSTLVAYIATNFAVSTRATSAVGQKIAAAGIAIAVILNILVWFVVKGDLIIVTADSIIRRVIPVVPQFSGFSFAGALGMGYYTLQIIGYIIDCTWGLIKPEKNPLKLFLFVSFFPQLITGPISRYSQLESLYEEHFFSYQVISFGAQRILWGFFKKIVLAERLGSIVNGIWADPGAFYGYYHWVALLLYPLQMYADFSGCMDIVLGTAEVFGIRMPENFNNPFFSRTSKEFWQRWHITLGSWAKDYVLYPLLKSKLMIKCSKFMRKKFGKKVGKFISTSIGMFFLWMVMGIWHGAAKYIVGVSLWYWIVLMLGDLLEPAFRVINQKLGFKVESFSWHLFQSARTYLIYAVGAVFFRADSMGDAWRFLKSLFTVFDKNSGAWNPWIFFDGSITNLGVTYVDINVIMLGIVLLLLIGLLRERHGYAREWMLRQSVVFRYMVWIGLFVFVLIFGKYGPGFLGGNFIYQGF
jgi:D-alanyl-lipoteichoic acid acyltransferase DltB (MBOAT superfamily)